MYTVEGERLVDEREWIEGTPEVAGDAVEVVEGDFVEGFLRDFVAEVAGDSLGVAVGDFAEECVEVAVGAFQEDFDPGEEVVGDSVRDSAGDSVQKVVQEVVEEFAGEFAEEVGAELE